MLDLRRPTIVIAGIWNDAILNEAAWVAEHVLDLQEGAEIEVPQLLYSEVGEPQKIANLYNNFGFSCQRGRLEIFVSGIDTRAEAYRAVQKVAEKLPFTPVGAIGVNFAHYFSDSAAALELLQTSERLEEVGQNIESSRLDRFVLPSEIAGERVTLIMNRRTNFENLVLEFNYHQDIAGLSQIPDWVNADPIEKYRDHCWNIIDEAYNLDVEGEISLWSK